MKVGIDARFITRSPRRGIGNYSLNLVSELVNLDPGVRYVLYIAEPDMEEILPSAPNVTIRLLRPNFYPIWENVSLPIAAFKDRLDVLHCLGNTAPLMMLRQVKLVLTLMDVMFLQSNQIVPKPKTLYQWMGGIYRAFSAPFAARSANTVIAMSEFARQDILREIPRVNPSRVCVTHMSCDPVFCFESTEMKRGVVDNIYGRYVLCLGAEDPRKNTLRLVKVYLKLLEQHSITENLIVSGYANWEKSESYLAVKEAGAETRVKFLDYVNINELAQLYRNATVFVYPSIYEAFGMPILEAFSSGCPVIASNISAIPDVGADAALYFNPLSEGDMLQLLLSVLNDFHLRENLKAKGYIRAKQFSWTATAKKTLAIYKD